MNEQGQTYKTHFKMNETKNLIAWLMNESNCFPPNAPEYSAIIYQLEKYEELKKDVKRYFEIIFVFKNTMWACEEDSKPYLDEFTVLKEKLSKVGEK